MGGRRVWITGHRGLLGTALRKRFSGDELITASRAELDLTDRSAVDKFIAARCPDIVIHAAARVGGPKVLAEKPSEFLAENLRMQDAVICGAFDAGVGQLVFVGSSACYPNGASQPFVEQSLFGPGEYEPSLRPYLLAKLAGVELCAILRAEHGVDFFSVMPSNMYGPSDRLDPREAGVGPALMHRFFHALPDRPVEVWGTGRAERELLHSEDCASAIDFMLRHPAEDRPSWINVGSGNCTTIRCLAETIQKIIGHAGPLEFDASKPEGFAKKQVDVSWLLDRGWRPKYDLEAGFRAYFEWFRNSPFA